MVNLEGIVKVREKIVAQNKLLRVTEEFDRVFSLILDWVSQTTEIWYLHDCSDIFIFT